MFSWAIPFFKRYCCAPVLVLASLSLLERPRQAGSVADKAMLVPTYLGCWYTCALGTVPTVGSISLAPLV